MVSQYSEKILNGYGWGGNEFENQNNVKDFQYNFVDSSYAKNIFDFGIIFSVLVIAAYTYILIQNYKNKNYWLIVSVFIVLIWAFVEPYLINVGRNIFTISLIPTLEIGKIEKYKRKKKMK